MPYDHCLFDLDGTLTDSKEGILNSLRYAAARFGVEIPPDGFDRFIGPAIRDSFKQNFGFNNARAEEATAVYREYFSSKGIYENKLYPGVAEMLERLSERGVTISLATSKTAAYAERILKHFGVDRYFSFVAGSEFDGRRSDKKELILYAMKNIDGMKLKCRPAVMAGDREYDVTGAKQAGIKCVGVTYGYGAPEELTSADYIADDTEELTEIILYG